MFRLIAYGKQCTLPVKIRVNLRLNFVNQSVRALKSEIQLCPQNLSVRSLLLCCIVVKIPTLVSIFATLAKDHVSETIK